MTRKSKAILIAIFFGGIGIHKFYLGEDGKGIAYLLFFWTGIPAILAIIFIIRSAFMKLEEWNKKYPVSPTK